MRITLMRGLALAALMFSGLTSGCATSPAAQRDSIRDKIEIVEKSPNVVTMTLIHRFYSGGSFHDEWPRERAKFAQRVFLLAVAEEAAARDAPAFEMKDLDRGWKSRGMSDGFRMYEVTTTVNMRADVTFLEAFPPKREDGVYSTEEALTLFRIAG